MEIWDSRQSPQFLRDCAYNVAHYLLEKGAVLRAGETIGLSDDERIAITVEPSRWDECDAGHPAGSVKERRRAEGGRRKGHASHNVPPGIRHPRRRLLNVVVPRLLAGRRRRRNPAILGRRRLVGELVRNNPSATRPTPTTASAHAIVGPNQRQPARESAHNEYDADNDVNDSAHRRPPFDDVGLRCQNVAVNRRSAGGAILAGHRDNCSRSPPFFCM